MCFLRRVLYSFYSYLNMNQSAVWEKVLSDGEHVEYEFSIGEQYSKYLLIMWGIISVPLLFAVGMGVLTFLLALFYYGFYLKAANVYAFTNKRVLVHTGWLSTHLISVDYDRITDVSVKEPFFDRLLTKTGHLAINTAGSHTNEVVLLHIASPYETKKKLNQIRDKK